MTEVLGIGMTHYPLLLTTDDHMADLMRFVLMDPDIPAERKDPANWSELAQEEWADDVAAAARHRARLLANLKQARKALDEFNPDVVLVWGDDQYEHFREEIIPSFCILAYDDTEVDPFAQLELMRNPPNAWGLPDGQTFTMKGDRAFAKYLAKSVLADGVDVAYSYELRHGIHHFPHAFSNTQVYLDYDNVGKDFPYPIVSLAVNCYGSHVVARRGGMATFADIAKETDETIDPPGPTPQRCFEFGRAIGRAVRESGRRVALVASASWSHAFLNDKDWHVRPDMAADRQMYDALVAGDVDTWLSKSVNDVVSAGQHEILNWYCLLGAMTELELSLTWSDFVESEILNSNKAFALFQ